VLAADYPFLDVLWTMLIFFAWVIWFWILITVFADLFRRKDVGGGSKVLWVIFVIIVPFLGVLIYLIVHGGDMAQRDIQQAQAQKEAFDDYVRQTATTGPSSADELSKLATLHQQGVLTDAEFAAQKAKLLG